MKLDDKIKNLFVSFVGFFEESLLKIDESQEDGTIEVSLESISNLHKSFPVELIKEKKELRELAVVTKDLFVEVIEKLNKIENIGGSHVDVSLKHIMKIGFEFDKVVEHFRNKKSVSPIGSWY